MRTRWCVLWGFLPFLPFVMPFHSFGQGPLLLLRTPLIGMLGFFLLCITGLTALAVQSYDGRCYGFPDHAWSCSILEFIVICSVYGLINYLPITLAWIALAVPIAITYLCSFLVCRRHARRTPSAEGA